MMRADHREAIALFARQAKIRIRSEKHRAFVLHAVWRFLVSIPRCPIERITRRDLERYLARRGPADGYGASTRARELQALNVFFAALLGQELIASHPAAGLAINAPPPAPPVLLSEDAVGELLVAAAERPLASKRPRPEQTAALALRDRALLELLYAVGLRDAEARAALVVDLDLEDRSLLVRAVKRGRQRRVPLPPRAVAAVERYLREARPRFASAPRNGEGDPGHLLLTTWGTPLSQSTAFGIVRRAAEQADRRAHPHAFRRAVATHLMQAKAPLPAVQALLGHKSLETTARYLEVDPDELHATVALLEDDLEKDPGNRAEPTPSSEPKRRRRTAAKR